MLVSRTRFGLPNLPKKNTEIKVTPSFVSWYAPKVRKARENDLARNLGFETALPN